VKKVPPPAKRAPHPANTPLPTAPAPTGPVNPYPQGNVASDLRVHGYTLSIDVNSLKSPPPRPTSTPRVTQEYTQGEVESNSVGEASPQPNSLGEQESREKYYPGEATRVDESPSGRSQRAPRAVPREPGITRVDVIEIVGEAMKQIAEVISPEVKPGENLPQDVQLPLEDVQLAGEKVNYRIALNPEIFFRYSVFKARVKALGRTWDAARSLCVTRNLLVLSLWGFLGTVFSYNPRQLD
jgi:hypothetical protein